MLGITPITLSTRSRRSSSRRRRRTVEKQEDVGRKKQRFFEDHQLGRRDVRDVLLLSSSSPRATTEVVNANERLPAVWGKEKKRVREGVVGIVLQHR
jgi:hypothetical protein